MVGFSKLAPQYSVKSGEVESADSTDVLITALGKTRDRCRSLALEVLSNAFSADLDGEIFRSASAHLVQRRSYSSEEIGASIDQSSWHAARETGDCLEENTIKTPSG